METPLVQDVNYLRLHYLNEKIVPLVVRTLFNRYFHSHQCDQLYIYKIFNEYAMQLKLMKDRHIISPHEWKSLFPSIGMGILS